MHSRDCCSTGGLRTIGLPTICVGILLAVASAGAQVPWIMPWNDALPGATDFSNLNHPIGTERVSVDTRGHFVAGGERVRFLGVNFAGDSPFMPTNHADAVAARLAKFGINGVRFHHLDASWAYNGGLLNYNHGTGTSTNFRPAQLETLHYLISRLKAHGIYSDINLLVGRSYLPNDGLGPEAGGMDWKDAHILGMFYPPALELHKDYASKLLAPTNRFTGLPLGRDPAVAFVEIINENGILQKWVEGALDHLPPRYLGSLRDRWNEWLSAHYPSESAMLAAWRAVDRPLGPNLLVNGAFTNGLAQWNFEQHGGASATLTRVNEFTDGAPCARVEVIQPSDAAWHIQLNYPNLPLFSNQIYTLSFWAKSSPATNADCSVMQAHADWQGLGYAQSLRLGPEWQPFTATFAPTSSDTNARVNFGGMGNKPATFWYADVRLQPGGQLGVLPPGASLVAGSVPNLVHSGAGYIGTPEARRDWLRFLCDLENRYYDAMLAHLRDDLGYTGLVFGTIMANSPAGVQSRLDVIDGHAYWQHPIFPGAPWDAGNWRVPNLSMVNTLDNTLAGLARQRLKGKPFMVTEYQHPSPNYYGGEGPVLLAAYAALQDWDGFWMFDYGPGSPAATMGYVRGYFEIGQHPTKMVNLLVAANLFRRGHARQAAGEITLPLTPERELDLLQSAAPWSIFSSGQLGVPGKHAFVSRLSTDYGNHPVGLAEPPRAPEGNVLVSDTGELAWDVSLENRGLVTVNTAQTKAVVGFADHRAVDLGGITLEPGTTKLGYATLALSVTRGEVLTNDCSALIIATGWWENTGQAWTDSTKTSVGMQWGSPPVLAEVVPFAITLPVGTNHVQVWSLDPRGQRKSALPITGTDSRTVINADTNTGSLWYELRVARWTASYDAWRDRYFGAGQTNWMSHESAAPDGDGVANLWKYYLGLPGRASAPASRLPAASLVQIGTENFLSVSVVRDPLAEDIFCAPQVSSDLTHWFSGPGCALLDSSVELGDLRREIYREVEPLGSGAARYLRLQIHRQ